MVKNKPKNLAEHNKLAEKKFISFCVHSNAGSISAPERRSAGTNSFSLSQLAVTDGTTELTAMTVRSC